MSIAQALEDTDSNHMSDRLGKRVRVSGIVMITPFRALGGTSVRTYVQDDTAAIRCVGSDFSLFTGIDQGDRVVAVGTIGAYRGMEQLDLESMELIDSPGCPPPKAVSVGDLLSRRLLGQLVSVTADVRPPILSADAWLTDESGTIRLFFPDRFLRDTHLSELLTRGGTVRAVGFLEQRDSRLPLDAGFRLRLASPRDLTEVQRPPYLLFVAIGSGIVLVGVFVWYLRRRARETAPQSVGSADVATVARLDGLQSHKMEALGTLAGGIAHDFNNYLLAIVGFAELARDEVSVDSPAHEHLAEVLATSRRAKELVDKILEFGRKADPGLEPVDAAEVVQQGVRLLRAVLPANIDLQEQIDERAGIVRASANQLHQVLLNLGANAADAMRETGGSLRVALDRVEIDATQAKDLQLSRPGPCVRLTVGDSGPGMDDHTLQRMYDPFFTTKGAGAGTGLGLSVVHGILRSHSAAVRVTSDADVGTIFHIYLPVSSDLIAKRPPEHLPAPTGHERILLVDDEESLVVLGRTQLSRLGYDVECETDGERALRRFLSSAKPFDAVVTDYTMPGMSGLELARRVKRARPDVPILLTTGFSQKLSLGRAAEAGIAEILAKPYRRSDLAQAVRRTLDRVEPVAGEDVAGGQAG